MSTFHIIIPARYQSSRLPGKLLLSLGNKSILQRVYEQALLARPESICIATDNELIAQHCQQFSAPVVMTSAAHSSGTDRLAEVVRSGSYQPDDIIVNVQADEPFIAPALIQQVAGNLAQSRAVIATLCWPLHDSAQVHNPNIVKVVRNQYNEALYFSRSAIPFCRDNPQNIEQVYRHIGLYAYRVHFLADYSRFPSCALENIEMLEQLRVLWLGYKIQVEEAIIEPLQDINTHEDFLRAEQLVAQELD